MSVVFDGAFVGTTGPSGLEPSRAVQIVAVRETGGRVLGSGYLVTGTAVLTASHVVRDAATVYARFVTQDRRTAELECRTVWEHDAVDVAVLDIEDTAAVGLLTGSLAGVRFGCTRMKADCEALGFPRFKLRGDAASVYRDSHHAHGTIAPWSNARAGSLEFIVTGAPHDGPEHAGSAWEGMSGAAMWSGGCVVGVVAEQHRAEGPGTLTASRVEEWYRKVAPDRLETLCRLIGLPATVVELDRLTPSSSFSAAGQEEPIERLALSVRQQWRAEQRRRRLHDPYALSLRLKPADPAYFNERAPGLLTQEALSPRLDDQIAQIVAGYREISTGRLVVLGGAGAGKSVLLIHLVLELLRTRAHGGPVPVIFGLGSWNPATTELQDWLCELLVRDYPDLALRVQPGTSLAQMLLDEGRILPVLDGFDEIGAGLRYEALSALNQSGLKFLLTSRPAAYAEAVLPNDDGTEGRKRVPVRLNAPGIELGDLTPDDLAAYLRGGQGADADGPVRVSAWDPVLAQLRQQHRSEGASNVAAALTTPLMASLARTVCGDPPGESPLVLLEVERFAGPEAIQEHLLTEFLPAAYHPRRTGTPHVRGTGARPPWDLRRAEYWLGHLAAHLDRLPQGARAKSNDLTWWELGTTLPRFTRTVVIGLLAGLAFGVTTAISNVPVVLVDTPHGIEFALLRGLVAGLLHGIAAGLIFGLAYHFTSEGAAFRPSPVRISLVGRLRTFAGPRMRHGEVRPKFMTGFCGGLIVALTLVLIDRGVIDPLGLPDGQGGGGLTTALLFLAEISLGGGLVFGLMAWLEVPVPPGTTVRPVDLLETNRRNVVYNLLAWICVLGPLAGIIEGVQHGPLRGFLTGLVFGLVSAFAGGIGYGLTMTAWCQWVALCRIWLPLRGRLPWALIAFLDDAHERGVLLRSGAVYQFRHARLQDHLSRTFHERHRRRGHREPEVSHEG
ncbi:NACHT domain-containing protein [Streptomyces sp. NPDC049944]|uniref:NACHT domain-containing protein n=1 Tax=Streptomyces sp. NPDC049944 TaxID=3155657 RepID=UPI00343DA822